MNGKRNIQLALVAALALQAAWAAADVVTLTDGSRMVGTIESLTDGKLTLAFSRQELLRQRNFVTNAFTPGARDASIGELLDVLAEFQLIPEDLPIVRTDGFIDVNVVNYQASAAFRAGPVSFGATVGAARANMKASIQV